MFRDHFASTFPISIALVLAAALATVAALSA